MNTKQKQQELREKYREIQQERWGSNEDMIKYSIRKAARLVLLDNGSLVRIEKPTIKKDFCFGYSLSTHNTESYDKANEMAEVAIANEEYFVRENLKDMLEIREKLTGHSRDYGNNLIYPCVYPNAEGVEEVSSLLFRKEWDIREGGYTKLSENEIEVFIEAYDLEIEAFQKRLTAYLKRYGLSKINSWSYWRDE